MIQDNRLPPNARANASHRFTTVVGSFLSLFAIGFIMTSFSVFLKPLSTQFGWTREEISGASSIAFIVSGVMAIVAGMLVDRFSPRLIIAIYGVIGGCACLLLSRMSALWQLYFYYGALVGTMMANLIPVTSLITRLYKSQRGLMTGITIAGGTIGATVSAPVITKLIEDYSWNDTYIIMGIMVFLLVAASSLLIRDPSRLTSSVLQGTAIDVNITKTGEIKFYSAVRSANFWILATIFFCGGVVQQVISVHLIPYITDIGISAIVAAAIFSVVSGSSTVGNFGIGKISDIIGSRLSMVLGMTLLLVALLLLVMTDQVWTLYIFAILFGTGWGSTAMLRSVIVSELFGLQSHGTITGTIMFISTIGGAISPLGAGYIFDTKGRYHLAFLLTVFVAVIGVAMTLWLTFRIKRFSSGEVAQ